MNRYLRRAITGALAGSVGGLALAHTFDTTVIGFGLGATTLLPVLRGEAIDWSYIHAGSLFGSFVGHVIYGLFVGLIYAVANRLWVVLFYESDPLNREPSGVGERNLRALVWGAAASMTGGLLFSIVMYLTGTLPRVAVLVGGTSPALWFFILTLGVLLPVIPG